jgi:hypothetical protein
MRITALLTVVAIFAIGADRSPGQGDDKKSLKPTQRWAGKVGDDKKMEAAPKSGYLTTQDAFEKLWDAWGLKGTVPKIDFKKQIVFVNTSSGPNAIGTSYTLNAKGNLTAVSEQTLIDGPGFGYGIDVLDREGIKTYKGKPID